MMVYSVKAGPDVQPNLRPQGRPLSQHRSARNFAGAPRRPATAVLRSSRQVGRRIRHKALKPLISRKENEA
jgi:hypothetical protein